MIGIYLFSLLGWPILALGLMGVFSGFFYTASPFYLAKRGIGELFVGINFGILVTLGSFYVQTQQFIWEVFFISLPLTFLITAILLVNEFPDYDADGRVGKRTLVVRMGRKQAINGYIILMSMAYITIIVPVILEITTPYTLLGLLSIPFAVKGVFYARRNYERSYDLIPANGSTIFCFLSTGFLLILAYMFEKFQLNNILSIGVTLVVLCALIYGIHRHIERQIQIFHGIKELAKRSKTKT
jgi:1,4-dihydroxy-2-naphthoate octaprenyltransferase